MKTKFSRILGVAVTVAILASMLVISPASAGNLSWTAPAAPAPPDRPSVVSNIDLVDIAVAPNGSTAYGVTGTDKNVYKTTNGGTSWTKMTTIAITGVGTAITKVAVPSDVADGSFVAIIADSNEVYVSENGGTTWTAMTAVTDSTSTTSAATLNSIAVSPSVGGARSVAVAGATSGPAAGVWYFTAGTGFGSGGGWTDALSTSWSATNNVTAAVTALAVKFSSNYISDRTMVVVTATSANTTFLNLANVATKLWNADYIVYGSAWNMGVSLLAGVTAAPTSAELDLTNAFMAFDTAARIGYVAVAGGSGSAMGLYRFNNTAVTRLSTISMHTVDVNAAGDKLVAGAQGDNTVYRVASPATATSAAVLPSSKSPSWTATMETNVAFFGANVGASTAGGAAGDESAFALSANDGLTFNDVALVDTVATAMDLAVKTDGAKTYLVTENTGSGVVSLWRKTTAWERVFKVAGTGYIVRPAFDNFDVVFVADAGGTFMYYSNDAGQTTWQPRVFYTLAASTITDVAAQSASVVYVLTATQVSKAIDGGFIWDNPVRTTGAGAGTSSSLRLVAADNLLVAGASGVAYTTDGGTTWTSTGLAISGGAAVAAADKLSSGGVITAVSVAGAVQRFTIGTSAAFSTAGLPAMAYTGGLSIAMQGGLTYIMSSSGTASSMAREKITAATWTTITSSTASLFDLQVSGSNLVALNSVANDIWSYTEIFAAAGPTQSAPADRYDVPLNIQTGRANDIPFVWTAISGSPVGTTYNLQIALDSGFTQVIYGSTGYTAISGTTVVIGPSQPAGFSPNFAGDTTYYWRIRADAPVDSKWSATRSFKIGPLAPFGLEAPASGATDVSVMPTFVWTPVQGATTYEIVVSDDPTFRIITFSRTTDKPLFAADEQLAYSTVYYWRVRASAPATAVTAFVNGVFTTEARPVAPTTPPPPVTITTQPAPTITVELPAPVEAIPAYLLWIIIGIGAILVIALIVLIVRTRRVS